MREIIKFKAWDKSLKKIVPVHVIDFEKKTVKTEGGWKTFDEIVLMECTGLRDNYNREIYEYHVVQDLEGDLWVVIYEDYGFSIYGGERFYTVDLIDPQLYEILGCVFEKEEWIDHFEDILKDK